MQLLQVSKGKLKLKNPILTASGTFGYGKEFEDFYDVSYLGGITIKGTTLNKKDGNFPPRIYESSGGILNSIGLANPGIEKIIMENKTYFESLKNSGCSVILNVNGEDAEEFAKVIEIADEAACFSYYEINVSCPNVKRGGISFSSTPETLFELVNFIRKRTKNTLIIKLSPNVQSVAPFVKASEDAGADCISLINTLKGISIDLDLKKPRFTNVFAGFSGPSIKPIALYHIYEARRVTNLPIIGMGGISNLNDILEFFSVGADAIAIGTMNFVNPCIAFNLLTELERYCETSLKNLDSIKLEFQAWMKK
jgi:dihydroorotate dehydrogenase (NAD+) catalytic subunit